VKFAIKAQSAIATPQDLKLAYMQQSMLPLGNLSSLNVALSFSSEMGSAAYVWTESSENMLEEDTQVDTPNTQIFGSKSNLWEGTTKNLGSTRIT